ncbi:MAG: hypothetical protein CMD14_09260 [Flavobacteriales bacterium]|nr:hypothetical protein [Flavobacteriales bacterium]|tara:strand:+ start:262 stop:702 length:441 start_codon:yes stop_codon:yes gene_type:complete
MLSNIQRSLATFNNSKFLLGVTMLLLNVGSRYVELGFSKTQEQALRNGLGREIFIFAVVFMGTRDIIISIMMTASFIILSDYLLNERSRFCIMPNSMKKISNVIDFNNDGIISPDEEEKALELLRKAERQKNFQKQAEFVSYINKY